MVKKNYNNTLSRFHLIPERHGQTNGQTDGRTDRQIGLEVSLELTREKNVSRGELAPQGSPL